MEEDEVGTNQNIPHRMRSVCLCSNRSCYDVPPDMKRQDNAIRMGTLREDELIDVLVG